MQLSWQGQHFCKSVMLRCHGGKFRVYRNDTFLAQTRRHRKFTVAVVLSHEEQLRTIQHQLALVYKLSVSSTLAVHLLTAVKSWQGQLVKGKPHPLGACSTAIGSVLLQQMIPVLPPEAKTAAETVLAGDLEEVGSCSWKASVWAPALLGL